MKARQLDALATLSGVPVTTLVKIRNGQTADPRIDTVRAFWPFVDQVERPDPVAA
ncbi:MAG: hypothetical protein KDF48_07075 [Rhodocyclaceae bacterium]|nr:hypothetical protein [Rhodocyclaceae bacterium]